MGYRTFASVIQPFSHVDVLAGKSMNKTDLNASSSKAEFSAAIVLSTDETARACECDSSQPERGSGRAMENCYWRHVQACHPPDAGVCLESREDMGMALE
jgi:hypothetical protein